ncbi:MAG: DNA recombination protein RmuC [Campylobacterota bacterium]|nr:DNA recombination protein RmuC [Campylobacterota bacterium]
MIVSIAIIVVLITIIVLMFLKNKKDIKKSQQLDENLKSQLSTNQQYQIEVVKLNERLNEKINIVEHLSKELLNIKDDLKIKDKELITLKEENSKYKTSLYEQNKANEEKVELLKNSEEKLKVEFKNLASEIFEKNNKSFSEQSQKNIEHILKPMNQQLNEFKKKVEDIHTQDNISRGELKNELKTLKELNNKISQDAINLTTALKGQNKSQGSWGEMVLEKVLESSGLREGFEYNREVSLKDEDDKTFRPDVIVNLPENRHIIIDAKTSLVSYNEYISIEDEVQKQIHIKNHIKSIKEHLKSLSNKKYEDLKNINSLDFIFMFVPIESALLIALENDLSLYDEAFKQKIILVSPTTLLVALRAVENTWRYEKQARSISEVYDRATKLYEKVEGFINTLDNVGKHIKKADLEYDKAFSQLSTGSGNVVRQIEMLKKVSNIQPKKELDGTLVENAV